MTKTEKGTKKVCLISSSGGHFEELITLSLLSDCYDTFIVTEKTEYNLYDGRINYFLPQVNRKDFLFVLKMLVILIKSLRVFRKEKPDVIISTGVLAAIPMMCVGRFFGKKVIYIETYAKINSPTMTGSFIYKRKIADRFYVQWESMKKFYPDAVYRGGIF